MANGIIVTLYLWHIATLLGAIAIGYGLGYRFPLEPLSGLWWLSRIGWLAVLTLILLGLVTVFSRFERPRNAGGRRMEDRSARSRPHRNHLSVSSPNPGLAPPTAPARQTTEARPKSEPAACKKGERVYLVLPILYPGDL